MLKAHLIDIHYKESSKADKIVDESNKNLLQKLAGPSMTLKAKIPSIGNETVKSLVWQCCSKFGSTVFPAQLKKRPKDYPMILMSTPRSVSLVGKLVNVYGSVLLKM